MSRAQYALYIDRAGRFELDYILAAMPKPYVAVMDGITSQLLFDTKQRDMSN